ncbi:MAG: bifunctional pyr operon transcriptional regulator/uracil phosphoribosyltransferase PyrR [Firmicutes bacterium]|nr:bifunctional pyr operon transcriptional regulator/uracil phosphoribosyltransferase PyrR [Bacillota bacterium]
MTNNGTGADVVVMHEDLIRRALARIAHEIVERAASVERVALVGILTRGYPLAARLCDLIGDIERVRPGLCAIDVRGYRDDRTERARASSTAEAVLFEQVHNRHVILVDDVLYTGRTVRAALDALTEGARPALVQLAVLIDRGHRELPIRPDYVGKNIPTARSERVAVRLCETDGEDVAILRKQVAREEDSPR